MPNVLKSKTITEGTFYVGDMGQDIAGLIIAADVL